MRPTFFTDLATLNGAQSVVVSTLENMIQQWEHEADNLAQDGDMVSALQVREWVFASHMLRAKIVAALGGLYFDAFETLSEQVAAQGTVELPKLPARSTSDSYLDTLQQCVASEQDCPF